MTNLKKICFLTLYVVCSTFLFLWFLTKLHAFFFFFFVLFFKEDLLFILWKFFYYFILCIYFKPTFLFFATEVYRTLLITLYFYFLFVSQIQIPYQRHFQHPAHLRSYDYVNCKGCAGVAWLGSSFSLWCIVLLALYYAKYSLLKSCQFCLVVAKQELVSSMKREWYAFVVIF